MAQLKAGVIGLGFGVQHLKTFHRYIDEVDIAAVCDIDQERAGEVAREYGVSKVYTDYGDLLADKDVDFICTGTPGFLHGDECLAALEAGKHILTTIPMVENADKLHQCMQLVKAVERTGLKLAMEQNMRWTDRSVTFRRLVKEGSIGEVCYAESEYTHSLVYLFEIDGKKTWRDGLGTTTQESIASGGGIHAIDTIRWIIGQDFTEVVGLGNRIYSPYRTVNDWETAIFRTTSGATVKAACCKAMAWPGCNTYMSLYGTKAAIEGDRANSLQGRAKVVGIACAEKERGLPGEVQPLEYRGIPLDPDIAENTGHGGGPYHNCRDFVDSILEDRLPFINVYEAAKSCAAAICALQSINNGGNKVYIPQFANRLGQSRDIV